MLNNCKHKKESATPSPPAISLLYRSKVHAGRVPVKGPIWVQLTGLNGISVLRVYDIQAYCLAAMRNAQQLAYGTWLSRLYPVRLMKIRIEGCEHGPVKVGRGMHIIDRQGQPYGAPHFERQTYTTTVGHATWYIDTPALHTSGPQSSSKSCFALGLHHHLQVFDHLCQQLSPAIILPCQCVKLAGLELVGPGH